MTNAKSVKGERSVLALNLRNARLAAGFATVSDAARHIGVPVPTAIAHEGAGVSFRRPKLDQLRRYATAYGTTIDALEGGTIVKPAKKPANKTVAYQLVAVALQGEFADQLVTLKVPANYKVGDKLTIKGTVSGVLRRGGGADASALK
jgi:hypothetical protein